MLRSFSLKGFAVACAVLLALQGCEDDALGPGPGGGPEVGPVASVSAAPDGEGHPNVGVLAFDLDGEAGGLPPFALCGGFVVSDDVFVTAAHCIPVAPSDAEWAVTLEPGSPDDPVVLPGIFPDDFLFPVCVVSFPGCGPPVGVEYAEEVVMHPRFGRPGDDGPFRHDVAVLRFPEGTFEGVDPVELPEKDLLDELAARGGLVGQGFTLVGYGTVPISREVPQKEVVGYRQVDRALFQALTRDWLHLQVTVEATGEGGPCTGDSGSPHFLGDSNLAVSLQGGKGREDPCGTGVAGTQRLDTPSEREFLGEFVDLP